MVSSENSAWICWIIRSCWISIHFGSAQRGSMNWRILDMAEKRFFTLGDSFIEDYMLHRFNRQSDIFFEYFGWSKHTLAADGGLIYAMCGGSRTGIRRHVVSNPVSKNLYRIAVPDINFSYDRDSVVMAVDKATQSYRIITMDSYDSRRARCRTVRERVCPYDSTTAQWRKLCEVPA